MPGGLLPRRDAELVILRVAHNCGSDYEWQHHERLGRVAGLTPGTSSGCARAPTLRAGSRARRCCCARPTSSTARADDRGRAVARARRGARRAAAVELCLLVGHYEMLAMTLNAARVELDPVAAGLALPGGARAPPARRALPGELSRYRRLTLKLRVRSVERLAAASMARTRTRYSPGGGAPQLGPEAPDGAPGR